MKANDIQLITWSPRRTSRAVDAFFRRPAIDAQAEQAAQRILASIRSQGDRAVLRCVKQFDGATLKARQLRLSTGDLKKADAAVDPAFKRAAKTAHQRITKFAKEGLRTNWSMKTPDGGSVGERFVPLERVGVYIPGGEAPLVSSALMTVTLARVAGVPDIVACTPADADGEVNPYILYALQLAGATEIYRVGGIQAIGAMAYGTKSIRKVLKIVGPGGPYVTAAKRLVYGDVDLDLVAGPSEIAVVVDSRANAKYAAADLLSQAEHGTGFEKVLLISTSMAKAKQIQKELVAQAATLSRRKAIERVLRKGTLLVVVSKQDEAVSLVNDFAPEHLELLVRNPAAYLRGITNAGAAFLGPWTPESAGDFVAGPSHVLPTGGTAKMFSGLTVETFRKKMSVIQFTKKDLEKTVSAISEFGRVEDLDGHARSAQIRFE